MAEKKPLIKNDQQLLIVSKRTVFDILVLLFVMFMALGNVGWWIFSDDEEEKKPEVKKEEVQPEKKEVQQIPLSKPLVEEKKEAQPKTEIETKKAEIKKEEKKEIKKEIKKAVVEKKEPEKAVDKTEKKGVGGGSPSAVQSLPASQVPAKPITKDELNKIQPAQAPTVQQGGVAAPPKAYKHVTAEMLTGKQPAKVPESIQLQQKAEREMAEIQRSLEQLPKEIGMDKSNPVGQATLANGTKMFIEYDKNNAPVKVAYIYKDGKKVIKNLDENGRAETVTVDGKLMSLKYADKPEGQTEISFLDLQGAVVEKRLYNDKGLIIEQEDKQSGENYKYSYEFENGVPVSYAKINRAGKETAKGDVADIEDIHMKTFFFSSGIGDGAVTSYTYIHDDKDNLIKIIENQNTENEVVRHFDDKSRLIKIEKKSTGSVYEYKYDDKNNLSQITIVSSDGKERTLKPGDSEFDMLESELERFDPVEFGKVIMEHRKLMEMTDRNVIRQNLKDIDRYKGLPSAKDLNPSSSQPVKVEAPRPASNTAVAVPAGAPSNPGAAASAVPKGPAKAPSVPGR